MKLSEYIKQLQDMQTKHGDVDVKVRNEHECSDLSVEIDFHDPLKPYYNKKICSH